MRKEPNERDDDTAEPLPESGRSFADALAEAEDDVQLSPLSIQAAALIRSMEALSGIFWISLGGTVLTLFFAGLNQLAANAHTDYIALGEYQVPKAILPLAALVFALFAFWMSANRLSMLAYVLETTRLPKAMVYEIFHLNPPVLHVFDRSNAARWSPFTGVAVWLLNWGVFFGNSVALTWGVAVQNVATMARFDWEMLAGFAILIVAVGVYGARSVIPPLQDIFQRLHGVPLVIGWPRWLVAGLAFVLVIAANNAEQLDIDDGPDELIGPALANAVDGETLLVNGIEVNLFGIDAMERDQVCQHADGTDYACGRAAIQALQRLVAAGPVVCLAFFAISDTRVAGACELVQDGIPPPRDADDFLDEQHQTQNLSRHMVAGGHALTIGFGKDIFGDEQRAAQAARIGIWGGSFEPPASWRARQR
jgi:endonuclease YncB( thermonuclease family)